MEEVKYFVEHMLLSSRDKIALLSFREDGVNIEVPFTNSWSEMRAGLNQIRAYGLTPMAKGLRGGLQYLQKQDIQSKTILVMITDGLPTISQGGNDPFQETILAAKELADTGIRFICIGLEPNIKFLEKLARVSQGSLYVVDELKKESLTKIMTKEQKSG